MQEYPFGLAIAAGGKGFAPKDLPAANRAFPGAAQKMRGTVIKELMLCCRDERDCLPCAMRRAFVID